jgi:hypothetical protein
MFKTLVVAGGLSLGLLASGGTSQALADSDIDIGIGLGGGYHQPGVQYARSGYRISCRQGARIVRSAGFRGVRAVDCDGSAYSYYGFRRDRMFQINVRSRDGSIRDISRLRGGYGGGGYDDGGYGDDYDDDDY